MSSYASEYLNQFYSKTVKQGTPCLNYLAKNPNLNKSIFQKKKNDNSKNY